MPVSDDDDVTRSSRGHGSHRPPVGGGGSYSGLGDGSSSSSGFVLVACKLDGGSGGMFQEMSRDANGARSGLIATLAAAKA